MESEEEFEVESESCEESEEELEKRRNYEGYFNYLAQERKKRLTKEIRKRKEEYNQGTVNYMASVAKFCVDRAPGLNTELLHDLIDRQSLKVVKNMNENDSVDYFKTENEQDKMELATIGLFMIAGIFLVSFDKNRPKV